MTAARPAIDEGTGSGIGAKVVGVAAVAALVLIVWAHWVFFWGGAEPFYFFDTDFYRKAVVAVITGAKTMYEAMAYPPFAYLFLWWLPSVPMVVGDQLWTAATFVVVIALAFLFALRAMEVIGRDWRERRWEFLTRGAASSILLIISMPMFSQLTTGQVSLFVAALAFVDVAGFVPKRFQGVLVGLAAAIKVTPMIFGVYYLITGQRRQAAVSVGSFAAFTAFGALFFPTETWTFWTRLNSSGQEVDPTLAYNFGIRSMLARYSAGLADATWLWAGLGLALLVVMLWRARKLHQRGQAMEAILIIGAASVLVPPNSLPHYFIWMPMAGLWLVMTGTTASKLLGVALYVLYSPLYFYVLLPALLPADRVWWNVLAVFTLVPALLGVFGLPKRPVRPDGVGDQTVSLPA